MNQDKENYSTDNLFVATTLRASGFKIKEITGELPHRAIFVFQPHKKIEQAVEAYWNDSIRIPPRYLLQTLKDTKDQLYEKSRSRGL